MELARRLGRLGRAGRRPWRIAIATFLGTGLAVLLVANLALGDKRIDQNVPSLYAVADPHSGAPWARCSGRGSSPATACRRW